METDPDISQLREAIRQARELQARIHRETASFPPDGAELRDKLRAAAGRTVINLERALEAFLKDQPPVH